MFQLGAGARWQSPLLPLFSSTVMEIIGKDIRKAKEIKRIQKEKWQGSYTQ